MLAIITAIAVRVVPQPPPFDLQFWKDNLQGYYDFDFIIDGLSNGFPVGIPDVAVMPTSGKRPSIPLAYEVKLAICEWLAKGVNKGYILGPFTPIQSI